MEDSSAKKNDDAFPPMKGAALRSDLRGVSTAQQLLAFSIAQFCVLHGISRSFYYVLEQTGRAPKTLNLGRRRLITVEAAQQWREEMTATGEDNRAEQ